MVTIENVYKYDFYKRYERATRHGIDDALEAYKLYQNNLSIINQVAHSYYYVNDYFNALDFILKGLNLEERYKSIEECYYTNKLAGDIYRKLGITNSSITYYNEAIKKISDQDSQRKRCDLLRHLSMVYTDTRTLDLATDYAVEALQLAELIREDKLIGDANLALCRIYSYRKLFDKSLKFGLKSIEMFKKLKESKAMVLTYLELASIYAYQNNPELSKTFYERAQFLSEEINYSSGIVFSNYLLGRLLYKQGNKERALYILEQALDESRRLNFHSHKVKLYYLLSDLYADSQDYELAYNAYKVGTELKNHQSSERNRERIYQLQNDYNLFVKEKQLKQYIEENVNLEKMNRQLNEEVKLDALTSLLNRRGLKRSIQNLGFDGSHMIVLSDIDNFKLINDEFGHPCGDVLLKGISKIFRDNSKSGVRIARWGGEEFLMVLPMTTIEACVEYTSTILKKVSHNTFDYKDHEFSVTMTFGIAPLIGDFETSIHLADQRLYYGKRNGKNQVVYK